MRLQTDQSVCPLSDWISIYQKDPALFDEKETPDAKPEPEKIAFIEDLKAGRRLDAGKVILHVLPVSPRGAPTHSPAFPLSLPPPSLTSLAMLSAHRFYGGTAYESSRSAEEKEAFRYALHETMDLWCGA